MEKFIKNNLIIDLQRFADYTETNPVTDTTVVEYGNNVSFNGGIKGGEVSFQLETTPKKIYVSSIEGGKITADFSIADTAISVEIGEVSSESTVNIQLGSGDDEITVGNVTTSTVEANAGDGDDEITFGTISGSTANIRTGEGADTVVVSGVTSTVVNDETIEGSVVITDGGYDGADNITVNNVAGGSVSFSQIATGSKIELNAISGYNTISFGEEALNGVDVNIVGGTEGDTITFGGISGGNVSVLAGEGDDSISLGDITNNDEDTLTNISIGAGTGNDTVEITSFGGENLTIDGGGGSNYLAVGEVTGGEVSINGGDDGDTISVGLENGVSGGTVNITAGDGANSIAVGDVTGGEVSINGGANNDTIAVASFTDGKLTIDGGVGENVVSLGGDSNGGEIFIGGSGANTVEIASFNGTALTVGGGTSNNISIAGISADEGNVSIEGGTEADSISIGDVTSGSISIDGGDGADFITVNSAGDDNYVTITAGEGDNITVGSGSVNFVDFNAGDDGAVTINGIEFKAADGSTSASLSFGEDGIHFLNAWTGTITAGVNNVTLTGFIPEDSEETEDYWITEKDKPYKVINGTFIQGAWAFVEGAAVREGTTAGDSAATVAQNITVKAYTDTTIHTVYGGGGDDIIFIETVSGAGELAITANGGADSIILTRLDGSAKLTIYGGENNDTIHLFNEEVTDEPLITGGNLTLSGEGGNDLISLDGAISDGNVLIDAGGNDDDNFDTIFISSISSGNVSVLGEGGADSIYISKIETSEGAANVYINGGADSDTIVVGGNNANLTIEGGADNDFVSLGGDSNSGEISIGGGNDSDTIIVDNFGGKLTIDGGAGKDFVSLGGDSNSGEIFIGGGNDSDTIIVDSFGGKLTIDGGAGNDSVSIGAIDSTSEDVKISIFGGAGDDSIYIGDTETDLSNGTVSVYGGDDEDYISIGKISGASVSVDGGGGDDEISLYSITDGKVTIDGGGGKDKISVGIKDDASSGITGGELVINAGTNTADTVAVAIESITDGSVTINGGATGDSITIADISGEDTISVFGNGGNDTISLGTIEGGNITVDGGSGADELSLYSISDGAVTINGGGGKDKISIGVKDDTNSGISGGSLLINTGSTGYDTVAVAIESILGGSVTINGGTAGDSISIADISGDETNVSVFGGAGDDTISLGTIEGGTILISGGTDADTIIVDSIVSSEDVTNNVNIVAGAGDVISVGSGSANFVDFETVKGSAVTINGVEFTASVDNSSSASLSFGTNAITLSSEWSGVIKASPEITFYGVDGSVWGGWTPSKENESYTVQSGSLYGGDVWAIINGQGVFDTLAEDHTDSVSNNILIKSMSDTERSVHGGTGADTINVAAEITVGTLNINADAGNDTITFGYVTVDADDKTTIGAISGGNVSVDAGAGNDVVSVIVPIDENANLTIDGGTGKDTISISGGDNPQIGGNIFIRGGDKDGETSGDNDTILVETFGGSTLIVDAGDGADLVSLSAIDNGEVSVVGGKGNDTIQIDAISSGFVTIDGGYGEDTITVNESGSYMLTVVAGVGDVISIGSGNANFVDFVAGEDAAVTINGVKFVSEKSVASALINIDSEGIIKFNDSLWSGTITAAEGISLKGVDDESAWTPTEGNDTYYVQNGNFFAGAWAVDVTSNKYFRAETNIATGGSSVRNDISLRAVEAADPIRMVQVNGTSNDSIEVDSVSGGTVTIDALGGNDTINIYGVSGVETTNAENSIISGNVSVVAGEGNDSITIGDIASSTVRVDAGNGVNTISVGETSGIDESYVTLAGGNGADSIYVYQVTNGEVSISGGSGDDTISVGLDGSGISGGIVNITAGDGANSIAVGAVTNSGEGDNTVASNVLIGAGSGNDTVEITSFGGENLTIDGGEGLNEIYINGVTSGEVSINSGDDGDTISVGLENGVSGGTVYVSAGNGANSISLGDVTSGNFSIGGGANNDTIAVASFTYGKLTIDGGAGKNVVSLVDSSNGGEIFIGGSGANTVEIASFSGTALTVGGGTSNNISIAAIETSDGNVSIEGGTGKDTIQVGDITGNVTINGGTETDSISIGDVTSSSISIDGGDGADFITVNSAGDDNYVTITAGKGDIISVGSGNVNFVDFDTSDDGAVTINGVKFKAADGSTSASLSFGDSLITFLDENWTGTITASEDVTIHGFNEAESDNWGYVTGRKDNTYVVQSGKLYNDVWAKVNTKGIRTGEVAQSADESLNIEVINDSLKTDTNYSILGSAIADTITGTDGNGIVISSGGISIDAGAGDNSITFGEVTGGNVSINSGADADTISFSSIIESGNVSVEAGDGADSISIGDVTGGNVTINGADGADTISIGNFGGNTLNVDGGSGADSITIGDISTGNVSLSGGDGDDTISIGEITDGNVTVVAGEVLNITGGSLTAAIPTSSTINGVTFTSNAEQNETVSVGSSTVYLNGWTGTLSAVDNITVSDKNGATVTGSKSYTMTDGAFATWATITNDTATLYAVQGDPINGTSDVDTITIADGVSSVSVDGNGGEDTIIAQTLTDVTINTNTDGDYISVTSGNIYVDITADSSTINGAMFTGTDAANVTIGNGIITVDSYDGTIVAGNNLTVSDKNGVTVTGEKTYIMTDGEFGTWATVSNGTNDTYVFKGETVVTGTESADTITISDAENVLVDGLAGVDTINANSLTNSTLNTDGDIISVTSGNIYASITGATTINGALFGNGGEADVTFGDGIITVNGYTGNITAGADLKVTDNRGATVTGGKAYSMTSGVFETWATISNGSNDSYAFAGDTVANGTDGNDRIVIETVESVLIDGKGGEDIITADSLTGSTIYAATDDINVTVGNFLASITGNSTINGAAFGTTGNANVTIDSEGIINVNGYTGNITAAGTSIVKDNRGATVNGDTTYTMTSGVFETWATINGNNYAFVGDTVATGTSGADTINIASAENVSINGYAGEDTITADSLSGATIKSEDGDYISVTSGNIYAQISANSTINGAMFSGSNSDAEITIGSGVITVDGFSGSITAGTNLTVKDNRGATVTGNKAYSMTSGVFETWATITNENGTLYAVVGDTLANGDSTADSIVVGEVENGLVNGNGGGDTITADNIGANLTIDGGADADLITIGTISNGAISVAGNAGNDTIQIETVNGGTVTINGGDDADFITVDSAGTDLVTVVAGAGDNISVGSGSVNFVNFTAGQAVTINGVEFKSDANNSASISVDDGITFLDAWNGIITASDDMTFKGFNETDSWTYTKGRKDNAYHVINGQLYNDAWAKVNTKGIRTGEVAQSADESLNIEVINELSTGNYSILGSASADTIGGVDGKIIVSGGNVSVDAGAGVDAITFGNVTGGNITVKSGADNDEVTFGNFGGSALNVDGGNGADSITIGDITNGFVSISGGDGDDTISLGTITGGNVTVVSGAGDSINVEGGSLNAAMATGTSTINGVTFTSNAEQNETVSVGSSTVYLNGWTGTLSAADNITVSDKNGATVTGSKSYTMTDGAFATWATIGNANETLYAVVGDTVANGTNEADLINVADMADVLINGQLGEDTVVAQSLAGATITSDGDYISVNGGNIYTEINGNSTINGATFTAQSNAEITMTSGALTVDGYTGNITANGLTVTDNRGATVTGSNAYEMVAGTFSTWATVSNGTNDSYAFSVDTVVTGTESADTITISDAANVLVDGLAGVDTINANSLTNATLNTDGDIISVTSGNIYASITGATTINGALFGNGGEADVTFGDGIITVNGYTGNITAGADLKVTDNRGATVTGGKAYSMTSGAFETWATINGNAYAFAGDTVATGTSGNDTINIASAADVSIDGKGGVDTILASSLTDATINANTDGDYISVTSGNIYASINGATTINGALFGTTGNANVTISGNNLNVNDYTGNITANGLKVTDNRGATITGGKAYSMTSGVFETWATINGNAYSFAGDTVATGTSGNDTINIASAANVSINGYAGEDTITAKSLTDATIKSEDGDYISVEGGNIYAQITADSTINGAMFSGSNSDAAVTISDGIITVDGYSGNITANGLKVTDNRGATVSGTRAYSISGGEFVTWATVNGNTYFFAGDTLAVGTDSADKINIASAANVSIDGLAGVDTITADSLTGATINADTDYISVTAGDIYANITTSSTINGAQFSGTSDAEITIGDGIITVDTYNGNVIAGDVTIKDKNGATVKGHRTYEMTDGAFQSWATINGNTFAIDPEAYGTENADTIQVSKAQDVLIDGLAGVDTITADSLTGATINASTDLISITAGDIYASIATDSTINGAQFSGTSNAEITIGDGIITVDTYSGKITAGNNLTVTDKRGSTVTGGVAYIMTNGAFSTWATVNGNTYVLTGDTLAVGTSGADTINIASAENVSIDGKGGIDTITADSLRGATINASTDLISVTAGDIYASIATDSTINGATFAGTSDAEITIGDGIITVDGYSGSITAGSLTVTDNRGATVSGTRAYSINGGEFVTWATINGNNYSFAGDTLAVGTSGADTINIASAADVSIDGLAGVDTITADSLTGATINASTDYISITAGDIYASIATDSTINGAQFSGTSNAEITIGDGIITVDGYSGSITAGTNLTVKDNRGATVTGGKAYSINGGEFVTWATINGNNYSFAGDTLAVGTSGADTINIASAADVSIDGKGGIDTITADSLRGATINAATDFITVTSGDIYASIATDSTINGATFAGTSDADITIGDGIITVDGYSGSITAGSLTVTDNRGATVTGNRDYEISGGEFVTWATVNNESYSFAGDTLAVGTDSADTINIASAADVSINGLAGVDTITADSLTGATITADGDFINVTSGDISFDITDGATINGVNFAGTSDAEVTIGDGVLTVDVFTGEITAGNVNITDNRGATVTGDKSYTMTGGSFTTWATINNNSYAVVGDSSAVGTASDDTITISDAENVLVDALAGIDTISADSLTNATVNAATDFITVTSGTLDLNVVTSSTINGAQFNGTGNADVTLDGSTIHLDTWTGYINFGEDVTLYDKTGSVIEAGNREFRNGILRTIHSWATINGDTYAIEDEDTVAVGTEGNDTINLEPYDNVSVNGLGGIDTIAADSIGAGVTIVANNDFIDITNGAATFEVFGKSTINGAQFNGTGNAQLSLSQDTITVSDWTGNVNINTDIKLVDKAGSTLTGEVTPILTSGTVSGITGLNNGEEIIFGGDTYTMRDDVLTVTRTTGTPEIYVNATSDTDLLNLSNPYAYIQISDNTLDLNSGAALLKNGFTAVIYGTESSYSTNYGAALTKDSSDNYALAQNNLTINEPQLVTSDVKVLTVDFDATLTAASGNYTINGDAYNATTDVTISVIPASSSLIDGTVKVTSGTIKTYDGNSYAISGTGVNLTALEGAVTNMRGTGNITASMNGDNSFSVNDIKYTAGETSNVNINLENDSPALTVTGGNINVELATGQSSNLNGATYTANSETAKLNATADTVTLTLPLNGNAKVGEITYTGLDEENSAVFSLSGTVTETSNGRFNVDIPQNISAVIDGTTYTSNQDVNTIEVPATEGVTLTSSTEKELDINDGVDNSTFDYRKVDVTATVGAATINSVNDDGTGLLEITGSTDATVSITSAVNYAYKLNGKNLRINGDADGYGAVANSDGTLSQLNAISSGVSVVSAPSVTLNTDSVGDYTFNNGSVTISGDSNVALVTDDRSNLTGVANLTNGALFTPMESFNLNGNAIGIYGDDGVTLQTDSAGNVVSVGGVTDGATINGVGGATVTLPNGGSLTLNDTPFKLADDEDGVTISGGRVEGLNNGGKLSVGTGANLIVNGVGITVPEGGATISADNASTPYVYTGQTASDSLANKIEEIINSEDNVTVNEFDSGASTDIDLAAEGKKSVVISENVSSDKAVNIDASNTDGAFIQNKSDAAVNVALGKNTTLVSSGSVNEVIDAAKAQNAVVVADNGANITNYDPIEKAVKILFEGLENIVQAIRTDYLAFSNSTIEFDGKKVSLQGTNEGVTANAAELYNLYMQPTAVQWSTDEGGDVIADSTKNSRNATQVLLGNKKGNKGSANIIGNNANIIAFIGAGDNIDAGGGDNYIEITTERSVNATGAKVILNEKSGNDVIVGFANGYDETADRISVSNNSGTSSRPTFKFVNGNLILHNNNRRLTFQNAYGNSSDSESDIGNVSKLLIETAGGEEKYAIADSDSTIKVDQYEVPDVYVGSGSTSGVDFSNYESDIEVNLLNSDKFQNIGNVKGAAGVHSLIGSTGNDVLIAGNGRASVWGGQGNDVMTGSSTDTKTNGTTFFFVEGDGNDTISNFEAYDATRQTTADVFSTYGQEVTGVYTSGDDLRVRVGNSDDIVRITDMKNKVVAVDLNGITEGAQVGDNLNYNGFTKYYYGLGNATLNVDIDNYSDDINIWLDGSDGKYYHNELNVVDASRSYKKAGIAGNTNDNKLIATSGGTSLWGGIGGADTLEGGEGPDTFFYGYGGGDDVINAVSSNDMIRAFNIDLSQITNIDVTDTNIRVTFNNGNKLSVNSANSGAQFVLDDGSIYTCDQLTRTWSKK